MDFDYTEEQRYLRGEAHRFLDAHAPLTVTRGAFEGAARGLYQTLWDRIAAQGWFGITIPESFGGLGLSHVELAAIAEEIGASLAPVPFGSTLYLFAESLLIAGSEEQKQRFLPRIAQGKLIGCAALFEGAGELDLTRISTVVTDGRLTGIKSPVVDGDIADMAVVLAKEGDAVGLYLATLDDPAVDRTPLEAIDGSVDVAALVFAAASVERLDADGGTIQRLLAQAAVLYAFEQIAGADRCLATVTEYVNQRQAFGGPVGRFQAVKHKLADLYVANQLARSHAYHGAWAIEHAPHRLIQAAAAARIAASDAYWQASKEAIHLHGAIGFTWEHDAHRFYRRAHHLSLALGGPQWWKDRLFETLVADAA